MRQPSLIAGYLDALAADPAARWAVAVAMAASTVRLGLSVRLLRPVLANG